MVPTSRPRPQRLYSQSCQLPVSLSADLCHLHVCEVDRLSVPTGAPGFTLCFPRDTIYYDGQCRDFWGFLRVSPGSLISSHQHTPLFNPAPLIISYSHSFILCHPLPHSWLGKIVGLAHHWCIIIIVRKIRLPDLELNAPILGWTLARRMVINHPDPFSPRRCTQSIKVQWSTPYFAPSPHQPVDYNYTSVVHHTNYFSQRRMS